MSLYVYILCHQEKNSVGFPSVSGEMPENIHISLKVYTKNCSNVILQNVNKKREIEMVIKFHHNNLKFYDLLLWYFECFIKKQTPKNIYFHSKMIFKKS